MISHHRRARARYDKAQLLLAECQIGYYPRSLPGQPIPRPAGAWRVSGGLLAVAATFALVLNNTPTVIPQASAIQPAHYERLIEVPPPSIPQPVAAVAIPVIVMSESTERCQRVEDTEASIVIIRCP